MEILGFFSYVRSSLTWTELVQAEAKESGDSGAKLELFIFPIFIILICYISSDRDSAEVDCQVSCGLILVLAQRWVMGTTFFYPYLLILTQVKEKEIELSSEMANFWLTRIFLFQSLSPTVLSFLLFIALGFWNLVLFWWIGKQFL